MYNLSEKAKIYYNEPMNKHTTFNIGGPAEIFIVPADFEDIIKVIKGGDKVFVMGNGSNLLVNDSGIKGIVLSMVNSLTSVEIKENYIEAGSGISITSLTKIAQENGLTGLEWAYGIPGTLGGAVSMNAGAYGGQMSDVIVETDYIDENGKISTIKNIEHNFGYRSSIFNTGKLTSVITKCKIKLNFDEKESILKKMEENLLKRKTKQPLEYPSAGSIFKRPEGYFAGQLIEEAGLKGYRVGGAAVSEKHAGFIINLGNATAEDVKKLIKTIQNTIYEKNNILLETEVKMI